MNKNYKKLGPERSVAQRIGADAESTLMANRPEAWTLGRNGGDDFGVDYNATLFDPSDQGGEYYFNIQLKGTTQESQFSAKGAHIAHPFDRKTLNIWNRSGLAILVVIADLTKSRDPKVASVHYLLANPLLAEVLPALPDDQKTVTLHVPVDQLVHRDLDILPEIGRYLDELEEGRRLVKERRRAAGEPTEAESVATVASSANIAVGAEAGGDDIEGLIDAAQHKVDLEAALNAVRAGNYEKTIALATAVLERGDASDQDRGIAFYLAFLAYDATGVEVRANETLDAALKLLPGCDEIAGAALQRTFDAIPLGPEGAEAREQLFKDMPEQVGLGVASVQSKAYALDREFGRAREALSPFPPEKTIISRMIISVVENDWLRVLSEVQEAKANPSLREKPRFWVSTLEARAHFELAFEKVKRPEGDYIVPASGLPGIEYNSLRAAYVSSLEAVLGAQRLNWPVHVKHLLDVFPISSMLLGKNQEALPLLSAMALARPRSRVIRECAAKMAVLMEQPMLAVQLSELSEGAELFEHEASVMAMAAYKAGLVSRALSYVTEEFLADPSTADVHLSSLLALGIAAEATLHGELLQKIQDRLNLDEKSRNFGEILKCALVVQRNLLRRLEAILKLRDYWRSNGYPEVVGHQILTNLDPSDAEEAAVFVEVADKVEVEGALGAEHQAGYGQALLTLGRLGEAVSRMRAAANRFQDDHRIQSLLGVSLELSGFSADAFKIFERLLRDGRASDTAKKYYVEIAARIGLFEKAEEQVRALYAGAKSNDRKLSLLSTLFQLIMAAGKRQQDLEDIAWEYGRLANQTSEHDEGVFLQQYLLATLPSAERDPDRVEEVRRRLDAYAERFPTSKYLWRVQVPVEGPPAAMVAALQAAAGVSDEDIEAGERNERLMDRGAMSAPFSWRPRRLLRNVPDVFVLWEMRKQFPPERQAFHFSCVNSGYERKIPEKLDSYEAVLSLTSILLLDEIGYLTLVLDVFPSLVIARSTLIAFQQECNALVGSIGRDRASRIVGELRKRFSKISHPPYLTEKRGDKLPLWFHEETEAMRQDGRVYFCDDVIETAAVCGFPQKSPTKPSVTTIHFLSWCDQVLNKISHKEVVQAIAHMTQLKIDGVPLEHRYFVAAIPDELAHAGSQVESEAALKNANALNAILDGVWNPTRPFRVLRGHFAGNLSYLVDMGAGNEVLVALWLHWLKAVRFQTKPAGSPLAKLTAGFVDTLDLIKADVGAVRRLWSSFREAIKRGLGAGLKEPEDIAAIGSVASALSRERLKTKETLWEKSLFAKAMLGLTPDTAEAQQFSEKYVEACAERTLADQSKSGD